MLVVKTYLHPSSIEGIGLFAAQDIPAGTIISKTVNDPSAAVYTAEAWRELEQTLHPESFRQLRRYAYKYIVDGLIYLNLDDTRFTNHSSEPNIALEGDNDVALRDIAAGEELLIDYRTFYDPAWFEETMRLT